MPVDKNNIFCSKIVELDIESTVKKLSDEGLKVSLENKFDLVPDHVNYYKIADEKSVVFYAGDDPHEISHLNNCLMICSFDLSPIPENVVAIRCDNPTLAFFIVSQAFAPSAPPPGIHPSAVVSEKARIHPSASIGPFCNIAEDCEISEGAIIHSNVTIYPNTIVGKRVIIESGSSIGASGTIWAWGPGNKQWCLPHFGGTIIRDDTFIGANVTIVKGSMLNTEIDELCHIAPGTRIGHDCRIGESTHLANGIALGGTTKIGKRCFIGSGVSTRPKVVIGDDITVGVGSVVINNCIEAHSTLVGVPAKPLNPDRTNYSGMPKPSEYIKKR